MLARPTVFAAVAIVGVAVLALVLAGCRNVSEGQPAPSSAASQAASARSAGLDPAFHVTTKQEGSCVVGAECKLLMHLVASSEFHVNPEYPHRFAPALPPRGLSFSVPQPAFQRESEREGTLPVTFTRSTPGATRIEGSFKLSVCSKETCLIEESKVAFDVVVVPTP
jgi:hypothetical protein